MDNLWIWLVIDLPSEEYEYMNSSVGTMKFPTEWKPIKCSKPPTRSWSNWCFFKICSETKQFLTHIGVQSVSLFVSTVPESRVFLRAQEVSNWSFTGGSTGLSHTPHGCFARRVRGGTHLFPSLLATPSLRFRPRKTGAAEQKREEQKI